MPCLHRALALTILLAGLVAAYSYHDYDNMTSYLSTLQQQNPGMATLTSAGKSVQGRELWVFGITGTVPVEWKPNVLILANIHGDETVGREVLIDVIAYMLEQYNQLYDVTHLLNHLNVYFVPSINPDGFELGTRTNAHGVDLNRNFPDHSSRPNPSLDDIEPEVQAIMNFLNSRKWLMVTNLHGGALVANYPLDNPLADGTRRAEYNDVLSTLASCYAQSHPSMWRSTEFVGGITNGVDWYYLVGGLQDYAYFWHGAMSLTLEIGDIKNPPANDIPSYLADNRPAVVSLAGECLLEAGGISGVVRDAATAQVMGQVQVQVAGRQQISTYTDDSGHFVLLLPPGESFDLIFTAEGYAVLQLVAESGIHAWQRIEATMKAPDSSTSGILPFYIPILSDWLEKFGDSALGSLLSPTTWILALVLCVPTLFVGLGMIAAGLVCILRQRQLQGSSPIPIPIPLSSPLSSEHEDGSAFMLQEGAMELEAVSEDAESVVSV
jgi:hypothetical protein